MNVVKGNLSVSGFVNERLSIGREHSLLRSDAKKLKLSRKIAHHQSNSASAYCESRQQGSSLNWGRVSMEKNGL
jgi:hypothetical protein